MSHFPESYTIGAAGGLRKMDTAEYDGDSRGIFWMWEAPQPGGVYCIGIDPSVGITGWNRYDRSRDDRKTDNGVIEVLRIGRDNAPDVQVGEFAAPIDATELGDIANVLGRLYAGIDDDQCKCILESYPGPGGLTLQRMLDLGYCSFYCHEYYADGPVSQTKSMGWHATQKSNRDLWLKASRHINLKQVVIRSPFLAEEYADCRMNPDKQWAENTNGHDDRVRAFNLAIWLANGFSLNIERTSEPVRQNTGGEWNCQALTMDEIKQEWAAALDRMGL